MQIRMLPISFSFSRFPRMVRDLSKKLGKKINLKLKGEQTELDKTVMEKIGDPLVHLVRNSLDHGIESPQDRLAAGKSETGVITLNAYHQGGNVVIEIIDDGKGLDKARIMEKAIENGLIPPGDSYSDEQINDLIFHPGFSTAQVVSDVSGRGVGMDVVKRNIQELNGTIEVKSKPGLGSTFTIRLPLTLAILDGQLVRIGSQTFIFPLVSIVESLDMDISLVNMVAGGCDVFRLRDEYIPIIKLFDVFSIDAEFTDIKDALLVVVECDGEKIGIVVDELQAQQQVVIKSLEQNYRRVEGVSGATILGDGTVALILDIVGIVKLAGVRHGSANYGIPNHNGMAERVA
jgi:two-component system chemotaxis sensor kinase CheA